MSTYHATVTQAAKMLGNLDRWLEKGVAFAETKGFDPNQLLASRLAPDQFALVRQVQSACDGAKFLAARLAGKEAPKHPDTETTMAELRARVASVIAYLEGFGPDDFAGTHERAISLPAFQGASMSADDYALEFAMPNFLFHVAHAYAILRHDGVVLGKRDYLGRLSLRAPG